MKNKGKLFNGNNRKRTRGRTVSSKEFIQERKDNKGEVITTLVDKGFTLHEAKRHLVSTCPQTGKKVYAKQGHAKEIAFITTLPAGTPLKEKWGRKYWTEQELTDGKAENLLW